MLHLLYLCKASVKIISDKSLAPIAEKDPFPDAQSRIIHDMLLDFVSKDPHSVHLRELLASILQHVKSQPQDDLNQSTLEPMGIKQLIIDSINDTFGYGDYITTEAYEEDESELYKKLVELCYDIKEFDTEKIEKSRTKDFSEYSIEDYRINLTVSYIYFVFAKYAYDVIYFLIKNKRWLLAHAEKFIEVTKCDVKLLRIIKPDFSRNTECLDYSLDRIASGEFKLENMNETLKIMKEQGVGTIFIICSMEDIYYFARCIKFSSAYEQIFPRRLHVAVKGKNVAVKLIEIYKGDALEGRLLNFVCRAYTKYEIMNMHELDGINESNLVRWRIFMQSKEIDIEFMNSRLQEILKTDGEESMNNAE